MQENKGGSAGWEPWEKTEEFGKKNSDAHEVPWQQQDLKAA